MSEPSDVSERDVEQVSAVVLLSGDLMFASKVKGAAEAAGYEFHFGGAIPETDSEVMWVIVDLATQSKVVDGLVEVCSEKCPRARLLAFGPHVQVARLEKARAAGIRTVLTRGQFDRSLATLFQSEPSPE
ncbi:MAG: histidine kinase [Planctomycetota bacterium]